MCGRGKNLEKCDTMIKIIYTKHAQEVLVQRGISKSLVDKTVRKPDFKLSGKEEKKIYLKDWGKNYLKVILATEEKELIIITFYWIDKNRFRKELNESKL